MRYKVNSYTFLEQQLLELNDDLTLPWNTYPCLEWTRGMARHGYGKVFDYSDHRRKWRRVHRVAYALAIGPIPVGLLVCHRCDNPACFRPIHLFLGTPLENSKDMVSKGRQAYPKGEGHVISKLTDSQVLEIRRLHAEGHGFSELGRKFSVSHVTIIYIAKRKIWKHLLP